MLREVLLHRHLAQTQWRKILPSLVFALNTSISNAAKCVPFGRTALLPQNIVFRDVFPDECGHNNANDYQHEVSATLVDVFKHVITTLELSKEQTQRQYNRNTIP